jgi:hypothetical protein
MYSATITPITPPAIINGIKNFSEPVKSQINPNKITGAANACNQNIILMSIFNPFIMW